MKCMEPNNSFFFTLFSYLLMVTSILLPFLNRYTSVQTNFNNNKKIEITHSKCKNKSSLPIHANVMRQTKKKAIAYNKNQQKERGNWR